MRPPFKKDQMFIFCNRSHISGVFNNCRRSFTHPGKSREAIINLPEPNKVSELKAFLGILNYYRRHLSTILEPLHELLRKGAKWKWQDRQKQSFRNAKMMLYSSKLLVHYDPSKSLIVSCDAFPCGIGAGISHTMPNGSEKPKAYVSRTLISAAKRNYAQIEKEGHFVVFTIRKFHQYLYGHRFTIFTVHKPLLGLIGENKAVPPLATARIQCWALLLSAYNYDSSY